MIPIYRIFAPKFFHVGIILALGIFENFVVSEFSIRFPVSLLIVSCHRETMLKISNILMNKFKMSKLFALLDSGIVVKMGPCGFIPVRLSIFRPYLGTSIPIFKILMGKWFRSFFTGSITCLRCTIVGWLLGSIRFNVLVLILFPSGVVVRIYSSSILLIQVRKYFSVTTLIVLISFCSIVFLASTVLLVVCLILLFTICSILFLAVCSIISLAFGTIVLLSFGAIILPAIILLVS